MSPAVFPKYHYHPHAYIIGSSYRFPASTIETWKRLNENADIHTENSSTLNHAMTLMEATQISLSVMGREASHSRWWYAAPIPRQTWYLMFWYAPRITPAPPYLNGQSIYLSVRVFIDRCRRTASSTLCAKIYLKLFNWLSLSTRMRRKMS